MNIVEKTLQEKSLNTEQSILMGQWEFDKKNIPNALKAIAIVFPHYSVHDESHSISILNNIVKMIGEEVVVKLSCTDLWFLLESAYSHDLGMVITADRLENALKNDDFLKHFMKVSADENHPCNIYTKCIIVKEGKLYFKEDEFSIKQFDAIRFLLADYFRGIHAENSKLTINDPVRGAGIDSPRSIIPPRLFALLSDICRAHTQGFDQVMKLPQNEDGIGLDECHPRFIACMLRLGDLLDIDNNRFSETLMKTVKALPSDSQTHFEKHKAVSHLSINTKRIEVEAECNTPKVAQVIQDWFDWISDEFKTQTLKWNSIVPQGLDCHLPTLNYLRTKIEGYETVNENKKPRFTIDTSKALELLQGKNFYNDAFDSIREIIQNAVDSTLIRIYLDAKKGNRHFDKLDDVFLEFAKKYPITVSLTEDNGHTIVEVTDKGTGLKRKDLTYLINTGSSSKNVDKKLVVEEMPEWMRPSGVFGIGFQSIFLLTDKVEVLTKDCFNDEKMNIEMYSPNSPMKGDVYLKKMKEPVEAGFLIRFEIKSNVKMVAAKDPFNALPDNLRMSIVEYKIREYASKSVVPIKILHKVNDEVREETIERHRFNYYDEKTGIELSFSEKSFEFTHIGGATYYYRNAKVAGNGAELMFLSPEVNIHYGSAKDILTLDRGSLKEGKDVLRRTIDAIVNFMNSPAYQTMMNGIVNKQNAGFKFSFFAEYYDRKGDINDAQSLADVKQFVIDGFGEKKLVKDIVGAPQLRFRTSSNQILSMKEENGVVTIEANLVPIMSPNFIVEMVKLLFKMATEEHKHCYCTERLVHSIFAGAEYLFTNEEAIPEIKLSIKDIKSNLEGTPSRSYINYLPGYEVIKIDSKVESGDIMESLMTKPIPNSKIEKMISPFLRINEKLYDCRNDDMYAYIQSVNGHGIDEIKTAYDRFVDEAVRAGVKLSERVK